MISVVLERLRGGYAPGQLFDPRSRVVYAIVLTALACGAALFRLRGFSFDPSLDVTPASWTFLGLVAAWLSRRAGHSSIATGLETTSLIYAQGFAFLLLIYSLMSFHLPFADADLAYLDGLLGFHWPDIAEPFRRNPELTGYAKVIYKSFNWQPALVTVTLATLGFHTRAWQFVTAATISLCITALIGCLLPADTAVVYFHTGSWPELVSAWKPSHVLHALRAGDRLLTPDLMTGLIAFPSYHACAATLFAWALWPVRFLRWPAVVLNVAVALISIVIGAHYLVDIIGGVLVGAAAIRMRTFVFAGWSSRLSPTVCRRLSMSSHR